LINPDLSISDYAPPPKPWEEIAPDKSWRNKLISDAWPALGNLVKESLPRILQNGENICAEIRGEDAELFSFEVNLAACGNNQILAVVRNHSDLRRLKEGTGWLDEVFTRNLDAILICDATGRIQQANHSGAALVGVLREDLVGKRLGSLYRSGKDEGAGFQQRIAMGLSRNNTWRCEEPVVTSEGVAISCSSEFQLIKNGPRENLLMLTIRARTGAPEGPPLLQPSSPGDGTLSRESTQHSFRNQLQLVTSLFNLEPQGVAARDAFIKWQIRLRSMAQALPYGGGSTVSVVPLIRHVADEVCSLTGQGPGRREVIVTGLEAIALPVQTAAPFSLLMGELIRLVVCEGQRGPGPELYLNLHESDGSLRLVVRPGTNRHFAFIDRESEIETLEILTEQIQGHLSVPDAADPTEQWELVVPLRPK
jgi:PAS domain-containing protein